MLALIVRGGWNAPSPDDFPGFEAAVEALMGDAPDAATTSAQNRTD
jgi:hypothetical protein